MIEPLESGSTDWSPQDWRSAGQNAESEDQNYEEILSDLESDSEGGQLVITEDDSFISEFDLDYDKDAIGTGSLDSFTGDLEPAAEADNPDPLSDSELNKLPDIEDLMTAELDHSVNEDEATLESINDELDALSVSSIEELAELDRQHRSNVEDDPFELTEDDFGLGLSDEDFGLTDEGEDDFFIDLTIDDALTESEPKADQDESSVEEALTELVADADPVISEPEEEELVLTSDLSLDTGNDAVTEKNEIPELSDDLDLFDGDGDDSLEWLDQDLPDDIFDESQSLASNSDPILETPDTLDSAILTEPSDSTEPSETNTGFTDWLEAVDIPEDPADSEPEDIKDLFPILSDSAVSTPEEPEVADAENVEIEDVLAGITIEEEPAAEIDSLAGDGSDDAFASGLFDFLSDEENQLNPLPEAQSAGQDAPVDPEIEDTNWEIDFDEFEVEDAPQISKDLGLVDDEVEFLEEVQSSEETTDDPFDTSWLDGELTEEIDLLSEQPQVEEPEPVAEDDLRAFAEKLDGDFDRLAPSDSGTAEPDFDEEVENVFASETHLDPSDPDISAEAADLNEMLEQANDEVRNATSGVEKEIESEVEAEIEEEADLTDLVNEMEAEAEFSIDEELEGLLEEVEVSVDPESDSSLDWLIPDESQEADLSTANDEEDLAWLSLLDDGVPEKSEDDSGEPNLPWTGDLSSAASSILLPEPEDNETKELSEDESPDWLNELPEYNTPSKETDKLSSESLDEDKEFTKKFDDEGDNESFPEDDSLDFAESDQEFDPIVFQESSSKQLPEWLADATLSASLGYEPESGTETDEEQEQSSDVSVEPELAEEIEESAKQIESATLEKASPESDLSLEDELDMEFDKDGNPIPPESQDLEDTLNWLEELATIDLEEDSSKIAINSKDNQPKAGDAAVAEPGSENDDPLSEIFSGGSALHAFANLEKESPDSAIVEEVVGDDQAEVSKETLNWLDNLFAPASSSNAETSDVVDAAEEAADVTEVAQNLTEDAELELPEDLFDEVVPESIEEIVEPEGLTSIEEAAETVTELTDDVDLPEDIFSELSEETVLDIDLPETDLGADIPSINLDSSDLPDLEAAIEEVDVDEVVSGSVDSSIVENVEVESVQAEAPAEPRNKGGGMFGIDDITVSQEEISQAVETGDVVPGMEDIPDDPDALMAWLNLEPEDEAVSAEPAAVEAEAEVTEAEPEVIAEVEVEEELELELAEALEEPAVADALESFTEPEAIEAEPAEAVEAVEAIESAAEETIETVAEEPKRPSMFGDSDDITVSEEEISRAVEEGDVVPGMEDIPDDPDALMAWLDLSPSDSDNEDDGLGLDLTEDIESSEADLIIADLGQDSEPVLEAKVGTSELNLDSLDIDDGLDDLFDDIAGPEGTDVEDEDLIFGDLGTGRLSGSDWLDQMTFDSDPALLGDVPTVLPSAADVAEIVEEVTDGGSEADLTDEIEANIEEVTADPVEAAVEDAIAEITETEAEVELPSLEELPDDPDEFIRILESNVDEPEIEEPEDDEPLPVSFDDELEAVNIEIEAPTSTEQVADEIPEWLKVDEQESDPALPWLDDASSSGVMSWLDADQAIKEQGIEALSADAGSNDAETMTVEDVSAEIAEPETIVEDDKGPESIFDAVPVDDEEVFSAKIEEYKQKLADGDDLPTLIRQIRESLAVKNDPTLQKILGDAYMESGQLQDALDAYRQAQRLL